MIAHSLAAVLVLAVAPFISGVNETPVEKLNYARQHIGGSPGELGYQAKQVGFDYRRHLGRAIDGKRAAFAALFDFTVDGRLTGGAARKHAEILSNLLRHWGDDFFSDVLRTRRPEVRRGVVSWMNSQEYPGWQPKKYPKTFRLGDESENQLHYR